MEIERISNFIEVVNIKVVHDTIAEVEESLQGSLNYLDDAERIFNHPELKGRVRKAKELMNGLATNILNYTKSYQDLCEALRQERDMLYASAQKEVSDIKAKLHSGLYFDEESRSILEQRIEILKKMKNANINGKFLLLNSRLGAILWVHCFLLSRLSKPSKSSQQRLIEAVGKTIPKTIAALLIPSLGLFFGIVEFIQNLNEETENLQTLNNELSKLDQYLADINEANELLNEANRHFRQFMSELKTKYD
jgi:hypothetical protein